MCSSSVRMPIGYRGVIVSALGDNKKIKKQQALLLMFCFYSIIMSAYCLYSVFSTPKLKHSKPVKLTQQVQKNNRTIAAAVVSEPPTIEPAKHKSTEQKLLKAVDEQESLKIISREMTATYPEESIDDSQNEINKDHLAVSEEAAGQTLLPSPSPPMVTKYLKNVGVFVSPFSTWPDVILQVGVVAGSGSYQSTLGPNVLNNALLNENQGGSFLLRYSMTPRFFGELYYNEADGQIADTSGYTIDKNFKSTWSGLSLAYRFYGNDENNLGYYAGAGVEHAQEYRFTYATSSLSQVINLPFILDELKATIGLDFRSYYLWRGNLAFNIFQTFNAVPGGSSNGGFNNLSTTYSDIAHYSAEASLSHIIVGNLYLGLGGEYQFHHYQFTSNESGTNQSGNVSTTHTLTKVFTGFEW
jgi:hypothetical protein